MMDNLAWGINLAVIGFFLASRRCLPKQRTWAQVAGDLSLPWLCGPATWRGE